MDKSISDRMKANFDIRRVLKNSVFYPASGVDHIDILHFPEFKSFVHVDYGATRESVEHFMRVRMSENGYRLLGICEVSKSMMTPNGFHPRPFIPNGYERRRLGIRRINDLFSARNFTPFALLAEYESSVGREDGDSERPMKVSLLHCGSESAATFEAIYVGAGLNPGALCIVGPSEGEDGDNWTLFTEPSYRLHELIKWNVIENGAVLPEILITDVTQPNLTCFWPEYGDGVSVDEKVGLVRFRLLH